MAQSQDLELEVKARTKDRTQCDEKCESPVGNQLPQQAQGLRVQFSMFKLGTRPNSRVLFVTSVTPRLRA
jgi:hypothetical protein